MALSSLGVHDDQGKLANAEVSAVMYDGEQLLLASQRHAYSWRVSLRDLSLTDNGPDSIRFHLTWHAFVKPYYADLGCHFLAKPADTTSPTIPQDSRLQRGRC